MTTEQMRQYLADGGTDMQYFMEWVTEQSTDPIAREFAGALFDNIEQDE
ncbi:MAG: hypothetical protein L0I76_23065 [Pseudonocardia sp.]|nr:hypothetical protein [Pseudonocardia sp.]